MDLRDRVDIAVNTEIDVALHWYSKYKLVKHLCETLQRLKLFNMHSMTMQRNQHGGCTITIVYNEDENRSFVELMI